MSFLIYCDTNLWSDFKEISVCSRQKIFTFTYILISKLLKDTVSWVLLLQVVWPPEKVRNK